MYIYNSKYKNKNNNKYNYIYSIKYKNTKYIVCTLLNIKYK